MTGPMPFEDVRVLDLSHALAGPFASTMLADFGARVVKVEPPGSGDISRGWGPPFSGGESVYFLNLNRNKKSVVIDLKRPEGRELFFRLMERSDVVLENFRVGTLDDLQIDYERARARHPPSSIVPSPASARPGPIETAPPSTSSCRRRAA